MAFKIKTRFKKDPPVLGPVKVPNTGAKTSTDLGDVLGSTFGKKDAAQGTVLGPLGANPAVSNVATPAAEKMITVSMNGYDTTMPESARAAVEQHNAVVAKNNEWLKTNPHGDENIGYPQGYTGTVRPGGKTGQDFLDWTGQDRSLQLNNTHSLVDHFNKSGVTDEQLLGVSGRDSRWGNRYNKPMVIKEPAVTPAVQPLEDYKSWIGGVKGDKLNPMPTDLPNKIPARKKNLGLQGGIGYYNNRVLEPPALKLDRLRLSKPPITQPDVDKPIAKMAGQASNVLQQSLVNGSDTASRIAGFGNVSNAFNNGASEVYDKSAGFTEQKREQGLGLINQEKGANNEISNTEKMDAVNWKRGRFNQVLGALSQANNQTAQANSMRDYENRLNGNNQLQSQYMLDMHQYDTAINDIDQKILAAGNSPSTGSVAQLAELHRQRDELNRMKMEHGNRYIQGKKNGGVIYSRHAKGGKILKSRTSKYRIPTSRVTTNNNNYITSSAMVASSSIAAIGKRYTYRGTGVKVPKITRR